MHNFSENLRLLPLKSQHIHEFEELSFLFTDTTEDALQLYTNLGLKPILTWMARPNHVKKLKAGRKVGYDQTHK